MPDGPPEPWQLGQGAAPVDRLEDLGVQRPPDDGARIEGDQTIVRYTVEVQCTRSDPAAAIAEMDTFLWRALFAKFGDAPIVKRGDYRVAYDSFGDDMGHHPGHDRAVLIQPVEPGDDGGGLLTGGII